MLTREDALRFLAVDLRIADVERRLRDDKLGLLNDTIRSYHNSVPFQNLTLFSAEEKDRAAPTPEQVKQDVLSGKGGLCMTQNFFVFYLLQSLEYDVFLISSNVSYPKNHVIVGARNVAEKDDVYLVEVGCGFPTFQAIPLNFQEESPVYQHSFLEYRFVKKGEMIERQQRRGDIRPLAPGQQPGTWRRYYDFTLEPRDEEFFREPMHTVCTVPGTSPFLQSLRIITFQKDRLRAIKDWSLLEEQEDHTLKETKIHSMSEMMGIIKELVDKIDQATVSKALSHWQEACE
ncbi:arylamine N-acetyltransferase, pineal gland isozyme NAT-3-like [Branchiostoma floridae x Branchiostoma belcheri]